jgi:hypothetical protein
MYKVVTEELKSLGLRKNPNIMLFPVGIWKHEPYEPQYDNKDWGGIWCCRKLSAARALKKYYEKRYGKAKIFECEIGNVLFENSYRTKTDGVKLLKEVIENE